MPYWQLFYHMIWATKNRLPLLTPSVEPIVHGFLRSKALGLGATVFALNGATDHVHLVAAIPPKIAVSKFIGQIKGVASTKFNKSVPKVPLFWQEEYGVFSFDGKRLPNYIAYVEQQKKHHAEDKAIPILERTDELGVRLMHEPSATFVLEEDTWRQELEKLA